MVLVTRTVYGAGARMLVLPAVSTSRGEMGDENVLETTVKKMREKRRMCRKREGEKKRRGSEEERGNTRHT